MKILNLMKIYEEFRDIPLRAPESINNVDNRCWGKHRRLYAKFQKKGFKSRFRVCTFLWSEQKIPENIIDLAPSDGDQHLFLEILINNKWLIVDCSNDSRLPEYNIWDGKSDCQIAVKHKKILSVEESKKVEEKEKKYYDTELLKYLRFYKGLNKFLEDIRKDK
ncbi:MAG: hypothetical protein ACP5OA_00960 [Candidatus Woesearchaeota archaeon]